MTHIDQVETVGRVVPGVELGVASAGIKKPGRIDTLLFSFAEGAVVSGVFTQNAFSAAPVLLAKKYIAQGSVRCFVINSGNANACTGERGIQDAVTCCSAAAALTGIGKEQVLPFSTGVIGEFLPVDKIQSALPDAVKALAPQNWEQAAKAIMTTDTRPKIASVTIEIAGESIVVTGIAKGAGMIRPNMATMLSYIATNASVTKPVLDQIVKIGADASFNRISIDGDTSTNDACMLTATGVTELPTIASMDSAPAQQLLSAIKAVMMALAHGIVKDGEGATKFVKITVEQGASQAECLQVAYAIAHSPLVKTALYASDANWGRIVAAIGYAGIKDLDASKVLVWLDDVLIVSEGQRALSYQEALGSAVVAQSEFQIKVALGRGDCADTVWTSDLSHEYVTINAEYRT